MALNKNLVFKVVIILLLSFSFFLGYYLRENSTGGGPEFYQLSWPIIQSFKKDFLFTINNYGTFADFTIPFSHIINAYLNPFSNKITNFQLSVTVISFLTVFIFAFALKKKNLEIKYIDILITSSVLLILPFYRTSAFWGKNENYGWLFIILAFYFFYKIKDDLTKEYNDKLTYNIALFTFMSSCALYARQALIFLPISYFLFLFINKSNKKIIFSSIFLFFLFAIPGIILIWIWGDFFDTKNLPPGNFFGWWINPMHILKNFPILLSFFGFYLLPILFIELYHLGLKKIFARYFKSFLFAVIIFSLLLQTDLLNYLGEYSRGGGAVLKINYILQKNNFLLLLLFSCIGFSVIMRFLNESPKNNIVLVLPILIIYGFPNLLYQEYVEPLILIMFFLALKTDLQKIFFKNIAFSNFIFLMYFSVYLAGSIYFKHFAFDTYEKWKIFLGIY